MHRLSPDVAVTTRPCADRPARSAASEAGRTHGPSARPHGPNDVHDIEDARASACPSAKPLAHSSACASVSAQAATARGVRWAALRPQIALLARVSERTWNGRRLNSLDAVRIRAAWPPRPRRRRVADATGPGSAPQAPRRFRRGAVAAGRVRPAAVLPCGRVAAPGALSVPGGGPAGLRGRRLPTESILALLPPRPGFRPLSEFLHSRFR